MTITKARTEKVDFSFPYYQSGLGVLTKDGTAVADLSELSGKKVAVQLGTTAAEKRLKFPILKYGRLITIPNHYLNLRKAA